MAKIIKEILKDEKESEDAIYKKKLKQEIDRQKLLYNRVFKHIPVIGKKYRDSIELRARMNVG